jgi:hypothetical protein
MQRLVQGSTAAGAASQADFESQSTNASLSLGLTQQQQQQQQQGLASVQRPLQLEPPLLSKLYSRRNMNCRIGAADAREPDVDAAYQYNAAAAAAHHAQQQRQALSAEEVAQHVAEHGGTYSWDAVEAMSICLAERDEGERLVFYPLKERYQRLLGDAEQRG